MDININPPMGSGCSKQEVTMQIDGELHTITAGDDYCLVVDKMPKTPKDKLAMVNILVAAIFGKNAFVSAINMRSQQSNAVLIYKGES